jgi:hypothetical protein
METEPSAFGVAITPQPTPQYGQAVFVPVSVLGAGVVMSASGEGGGEAARIHENAPVLHLERHDV